MEDVNFLRVQMKVSDESLICVKEVAFVNEEVGIFCARVVTDKDYKIRDARNAACFKFARKIHEDFCPWLVELRLSVDCRGGIFTAHFSCDACRTGESLAKTFGWTSGKIRAGNVELSHALVRWVS